MCVDGQALEEKELLLSAVPQQKTPDKSSKLNNLICHLPVPSRTTHESISIQPAAAQHNLLRAFQNQCWKINHCSQHDNTVANSILVERQQKPLFHTFANLISLDIFLFCVRLYISMLLVRTTIFKKKKNKRRKQIINLERRFSAWKHQLGSLCFSPLQVWTQQRKQPFTY